MKIYLLVAALLISKFSYSQADNNNTRPAFTLKLYVDDTTFYTAPMGATSYIVKESAVQVFPGEKIYVEADIANDSLVNFKVVPENLNKGKTLVITFTQTHQDKKHEQMILSVTNPFAKNLEYHSQIHLMKYKKWVTTSVLPVKPGLVSYENWPDIITTIVLYDLRLKD